MVHLIGIPAVFVAGAVVGAKFYPKVKAALAKTKKA